MTAFLRINGITVPTLDGSADESVDIIGSSKRGLDTTLVTERRAVKRKWGFTTTLQAPATGLAFRDLVLGRGWVWDFETGTGVYPANGGAIASGGTQSGTQKKFGSFGYSVPTAPSFAFNSFDPSVSPWTVSYWYYNGTVWAHRVESSGYGSTVYSNGSATTTPYFASSSFALGFFNPAAGRYLDDVWVTPYVWPIDWPLQFYTWGQKAALCPRITIDGLGIDNNLAAITALGEVNSVKQAQAWVGGAWTPNAVGVAGTLFEV